MPDQLTTAPVLSTPESHIFESPFPPSSTPSRSSDADILSIYEISRTTHEIRSGGWRRIALQFPDGMLHDAARVYDLLSKELDNGKVGGEAEVETEKRRLFILGDTSYGACCVDEIAAEHGDADVVVHYGRACLSPTARLPVIYIYTTRPLDLDAAVTAFWDVLPDKEEKVVLMADLVYHSHMRRLGERLKELGYKNLLIPEVVRDPEAGIPNRDTGLVEGSLKQHSIFHISDPPTSLLLTLSSRVKNLYIYPTSSTPHTALESNTALPLRRRYALLTSLSTCGVWGILINTLSVKNYLSTVSQIRHLIEKKGKKSYVFVVGKVNVPKIANFSEIGGWVVVGCWESSLIEGEGFYRGCVTPFELQLALQGDGERVWGGEWSGAFTALRQNSPGAGGDEGEEQQNDEEDMDSEPESTPPEFDLRTGRYVSHSRPMLSSIPSSSNPAIPGSRTANALARRPKLDIATVNGAVSPGAEYLRSQRTWMGLGSDFIDEEDGQRGAVIEEGMRGVARGYVVGIGDGDGQER